MNVLLVGEGDFRFARRLAEKMKTEDWHSSHIIATELRPQQELSLTYGKPFLDNINVLKKYCEAGYVTLRYEVDALAIDSIKVLLKERGGSEWLVIWIAPYVELPFDQRNRVQLNQEFKDKVSSLVPGYHYTVPDRSYDRWSYQSDTLISFFKVLSSIQSSLNLSIAVMLGLPRDMSSAYHRFNPLFHTKPWYSDCAVELGDAHEFKSTRNCATTNALHQGSFHGVVFFSKQSSAFREMVKEFFFRLKLSLSASPKFFSPEPDRAEGPSPKVTPSSGMSGFFCAVQQEKKEATAKRQLNYE